MKRGAKAEAYGNFRNAIVSCPYFGDALFLAGQLLTERGRGGDFEEALRLFGKVVEGNDGDADAWYYIGDTYRRMQKAQEALNGFTECLKRNPGDADAQKMATAMEGIIERGG
jgi:tetratricopeptide (TPR) repeat protein